MHGEGDIMAAETADTDVIEVSEVVRTPAADEHVGVRRVATEDLVLDLRPEDLDVGISGDGIDADPDPDAIADGAGTSAGNGHRAGDPQADHAATAAPKPLLGRIAVVTGGATGVGREVALGLARAGARVCVLGREIAQLRETVDLAGPESAILFLQCDVGSLSEIDGVVDFIERFDRPVDLLVHAEGVQVRGGVEHGSVTDLDEQYLVNVRGPYIMTQRLLDQLRGGRGHIVFVNASLADGLDVDFGQFAVTASAVSSLADTVRREVEPSGVRVTTVQPEAPVADHTTDAVVALSPADVARSVLHALQAPDDVEVTEVRLRPRRAAIRAD